MNEEHCGNCGYCVLEGESNEWVCNNEESDRYGEYTEYADSCEEWEERGW